VAVPLWPFLGVFRMNGTGEQTKGRSTRAANQGGLIV